MANGEQRHDAGGLPTHTTPTWEVELLISGVAVFAMLQLPGWLDDALFAMLPRLDANWGELLELVYIYARSTAMILAATFVIHLLLRARWIAMVGMHSVYPDGIRWDRLKMGPVQRRVEAELDEGPEAAIESADNGATTVFAIGVVMAIMIAIVAVLLVAVMGLLSFAKQLGLPIVPSVALLALFALVMLPFAALNAVDRRHGSRLPPDGRAARVLAAGLRGYARIGFGRSRNRIMALLGSHAGEYRMMMLTALLMTGTVVCALAWYDGLRNRDTLGSYAGFPRADADNGLPAMDPANYDDQRDIARDPAAPFIQRAVVHGSYLRLVVPYQPRRDAPALQRDCAAARNGDRDAQAVARFQCLQRLHPVLLDGKPLADLRYELGSDPRTDRPALVAMIDVRDLAQGRHELRVGQPPVPRGDGPAGKDAATDTEVGIPFWR